MRATESTPEQAAATIRVTALIDAYNYGRFINDAIESVLDQGLAAEDLEIIVVDDGSTDDTRARVEEYGGRVTYLYKENGGQASAFNVGISHAKGDIVALLDADDYWFPGKLRRVVEEFGRNSTLGLVYHPLRELRTQTGGWKEPNFHAVSGDVQSDRKKILQYTAAQTSGLSFRTRLIRELLPLNEAMTFDADAVLAALIIFLAPVAAIAEPFGAYRIHGDNHYFESESVPDRKRQAQRLAMLKIVVEEIDTWLRMRGYDVTGREISAFRKRWQLLYEREEFRFIPPGRMRFFFHHLRSMSCMNPCLNAKIQAVNAMNAVGSLLFGYDHYTRLDEWRLGLKRTLTRSDEHAG